MKRDRMFSTTGTPWRKFATCACIGLNYKLEPGAGIQKQIVSYKLERRERIRLLEVVTISADLIGKKKTWQVFKTYQAW